MIETNENISYNERFYLLLQKSPLGSWAPIFAERDSNTDVPTRILPKSNHIFASGFCIKLDGHYAGCEVLT